MAPHMWDRYQRDLQRVIVPASHRPDPRGWDDVGLHAAWLGHSTVLLKIEGTTVLTDPVFSERVGVSLGVATLGPKRLVTPALRAEELPPVDVVLLSHAHMDHFDLPSLRSLESRMARVVTASRTGDLLRGPKWAGVTELVWGQSVRLGALNIRAFEVRHWGARVQTDTWRGFNGYVIESPHYRVLFGGDTAMTDTFGQLRTTRGFDLGIMPIGAYNPWIQAHCSPEQAVQMANAAGAEFILGVHHQTFELGNEPRLQPMERLRSALVRTDHRLALSEIGQEFHLAR
ncbi:MAG: MBL fold metallo-hydrolase [Acidobacteriia bacterium]|nr:MBL fold metallo-hydrolase [Terriglobia bacterium]